MITSIEPMKDYAEGEFDGIIFEEDENNNSIKKANDMGTINGAYLITGSIKYHTADDDYFKFTAGADGTWAAVKEKTNTPLNYILELYDSAGNILARDTKNAPELVYSVKKGQTYYIRLAATSSVGYFRYYDLLMLLESDDPGAGPTPGPTPDPTPTPPPTSAPSKPTGLTAKVNDDNVILDWEDCSDSDGIDHYEIRYGTGGNYTVISETISWAFLSPGNGTFSWQVRAVDTLGNTSDWVSGDSFTVSFDNRADLFLEDLYTDKESYDSSDSVTISFRVGNQGNALAEATTVLIKAGDATREVEIPAIPLNFTQWYNGSVTIDAAEMGSGTVNISVQIDPYGEVSELSESNNQESVAISITAPPPDEEAPTKPSGLTYRQSGTEIILDWQDSTDNIGVAGYEYRYVARFGGTKPDFSNAEIFRTSWSSGSIDGLAEGEYYWQVRACDKAGNYSSWTSLLTSFTVAPPSNDPPSVPTGLTQTISGQKCSFDWADSWDNTDVAGYEFMLFTEKTGSSPSPVTVTDSNYSRTLADGNYSWRVRAFDGEGNYSAWSETVDFRVGAAQLPDLTFCKMDGWSSEIALAVNGPGTVSSGNMTVADYIFLQWGVSNSGIESVWDFITNVYLDGTFFDYDECGSLFPLEVVENNGSFLFENLSAGKHTLKIVLDPDDSVKESNENNNVFETSFYVHDTISVSNGEEVSGFYLPEMMKMLVNSGGKLTDTSIDSGNELLVQSGGKAEDITLFGGKMTVSGEAGNTRVDCAALEVHSGGKVVSQELTGSSWLVLSGGTAVDTTMDWNNRLLVLDGGTAENTIVGWGDKLTVSNGGKASGVILSSGGSMHIASGGYLTGQIHLENGGMVTADPGAEINFDLQNRTASDDALINDFSLLGRDADISVSVAAGQKSGSYKLASGVKTFQKSATLRGLYGDYGTLTCSGSGVVYAGKRFTLSSSGSSLLLNISEHSGGNVQLTSGGKFVSAGGTLSGVSLARGGVMTVYSGGLAADTPVYSRGSIVLSRGGVAENTGVYGDGALHVYSGGAASGTTVYRNGYLGVGLGATTYDTTIEYAGELTVWGGGKVLGNTINTWGAIILSSGAKADSTVINAKGGLHVYSGAVASNTTVNRDGFFGVGLGATTYDTTIGYAGALTVWGGGTVHRNTINTWGAIVLSSGAVANSTTVNANGGLHIYKGATAYTTTVASGANLGIGLGGCLHGAKLENNAVMTFYDGAKLGGWNDFAGTVKMQGKVDASGSYISLELQERTSEQGYLVSNISYFRNAARFSIEVKSTQTGTYKLACGATGFSRDFTLYVDDVDCGKVAVGKTLNYNGIDYNLLKQGDGLLLQIGDISRAYAYNITSGGTGGILA